MLFTLRLFMIQIEKAWFLKFHPASNYARSGRSRAKPALLTTQAGQTWIELSETASCIEKALQRYKCCYTFCPERDGKIRIEAVFRFSTKNRHVLGWNNLKQPKSCQINMRHDFWLINRNVFINKRNSVSFHFFKICFFENYSSNGNM